MLERQGDSNSANDECRLQGQVWDYQAGACAAGHSRQGVTCSAANNGCREYSGNTEQCGVVLNNDFEGTTHN